MAIFTVVASNFIKLQQVERFEEKDCCSAWKRDDSVQN